VEPPVKDTEDDTLCVHFAFDRCRELQVVDNGYGRPDGHGFHAKDIDNADLIPVNRVRRYRKEWRVDVNRAGYAGTGARSIPNRKELDEVF
jgi:hypothetical protein